jgi:UDP-glucose 4-epimerase
MQCLILGGRGFLGSHLVQALLAEGNEVSVFKRPHSPRLLNIPNHQHVRWFEGDFVNREDVAAAVQGAEIVYHLISTTIPQSSNLNPIYDIESNLVSTLNLLEIAKEAKVKKIIFVSSGGTVYGVPKSIPIPENHSTDPTCSYGVAKLAIEKYLSLYHRQYGLNYCILRVSNPYGERQLANSAQGVVAVFLGKVLQNEPIEIWGDGSVVRDYIYVGDAIEALMKAKSYEGNCRLFNIGGGKGLSLNELVDAIETMIGRPVQRKYLPGRSFDVPINILDIAAAERFLNWTPGTSFQEGLSRTWA